MTWDELNEKYPEVRDKMSTDREREFLKDLYATYETVGFVNKFWTPFDLNDEDKSYVGKTFKVIGRCEEGKEWDLESLPAWKIEFEDGHKMNAYPEKIYLNDMIANGYKPQRKMDKIWIFEMQDGIFGGFIIADSEEDAWVKLSLDRNIPIKNLKEVTIIYPITALDLNKSVHDLW